MAYIFRKLNNLISPTQPGAEGSSSSAIVADTSGTESSPGKNPYASSFRNPSAVFEANKGESLGSLDTGLQKSIAGQTKGMQESSQKYRGGLQDIAGKYSYNPEDISNINEDVSYGKLSKALNPNAQKAEISNLQSNTASYNPNTQSVAAASNTAGLSNLLRNQYGTTQGQSRLDALLYRGTGQAGQEIGKNLADIGQFRQGQAESLAAETGAQEAANLGATQRATELTSQLGAAGQGYQSAAEAARTAAQNEYNQRYAQDRAALESILQQESGYNAKDMEGLTNTIRDQLAKQGITGVEAEQLLPSYIQEYMLPGIDINPYLEQQTQFQVNEFLDPRYNRIASLLGTSGQTQLTPQDLAITRNEAGLREAIANAKAQRMAEANIAAQADESNNNSVKQMLTRAVAGGAIGTVPDQLRIALGLPVIGNAAESLGNRISSAFGW